MAFDARSLGFIGAEGGNPLPVFALIAGELTLKRVGEIVADPLFNGKAIAVALRLRFAGLRGSSGNDNL
jgi:hypothetical protein